MTLWDVATGQAIRTFQQGHTKAIEQLAYSPDGKTPRLHQPGWDRQALGFRRRLTDSHLERSPRRRAERDRFQPRRQDPPLGRRR